MKEKKCIKIAVANLKGGVGKTVTAINVSNILNEKGYKTLIVDCDPQCNTTAVFHAKTEDEATLYDVIMTDLPADQCIQSTDIGDIIASDPNLINIDSQVKSGPGMYKHIKKTLKYVEDEYDFVIFDTPPYNGLLLGNVLMACDKIIVPLELEAFGIDGLVNFSKTIDEFKEDNEGLGILGLLKIKYKKNQNLTKNLEENLLPEFAEKLDTKIFNTTIRESVKCKEAIALGIKLSDYAADSTTYLDYKDFVDEVIESI